VRTLIKRIAFILIPHIYVESENLRRGYSPNIPCIVASGISPKSTVLDYSKNIKNTSVKKGVFLKDIDISKKNINLMQVDYNYLDVINKSIISYLKNYSILTESDIFGEYYIDLTGTERLFGRELETCGKIITALKTTYGFTSKIGIGSNKLISYLASRLAEDGAVYDIIPSSEDIFLKPIDIRLLPYLSSSVRKELFSSYNITHVRQLEVFSKDDLKSIFGNDGLLLYNHSKNLSQNYLTEKKLQRS